MKIADYSLAMQSSHNQSMQTSVNESLHSWVDRPAQSSAPNGFSQNGVQVTLSSAALQKQAAEADGVDQDADNLANDPRMLLLKTIIEQLTGQKLKMFDPRQLQSAQLKLSGDSASAASATQHAGFGVDYSKTTTYSESEQTTMQASGVIKTSDGKEIQFNLDLTMQRQYSETSSTQVHLGDAKKTDPLVVNFDGTAAQVSDQRFAFDLKSDGNKEQINMLAPGSGFLALDKNNDGKVDNGSELFGTASGNGFSDLAKYDSDHNGWIDENDPIYSKLKVWTPDANGGGKLSDLAALGVGAISLQAADTPFDIKNASDQLLASVRASSVALKNNGSAVSVQQIDLTA